MSGSSLSHCKSTHSLKRSAIESWGRCATLRGGGLARVLCAGLGAKGAAKKHREEQAKPEARGNLAGFYDGLGAVLSAKFRWGVEYAKAKVRGIGAHLGLDVAGVPGAQHSDSEL